MIPTKKKKCKGRGLAHKHGCGQQQYIFKLGLCKPCYATFLFHSEEGKFMVEEAQKKAKKKIKEKRDNAIKNLYFQKRKPYVPLEKKQTDEIYLLTQTVCNNYIRMRDNTIYGIDVSGNGRIHDAGHFINVGDNPGILRYSPQNIHGQNARDNRYQGGNKDQYRVGLINRYGLAYVEELEKLHYQTMKVKTLDREIVLRINKLYKHLIKNEIMIYRHVEFLEMLNKI